MAGGNLRNCVTDRLAWGVDSYCTVFGNGCGPRNTISWGFSRIPHFRGNGVHNRVHNKVHNKSSEATGSAGQTQSRPQSQRPKPVVCIAFREMSAVDAIPCIRRLNSSAV